MEKKIRILMLEDTPADAELNKRELRKGEIDFTSKVVDTKEDFTKALKDFKPDIILSDYSLPAFDGISAMLITKSKFPELPFIFVSGAIGEDLAIETLKSGATDYVLKDKLSRLVPSVKRVIKELEELEEHKEADVKLNKQIRLSQLFLDSMPCIALLLKKETREIIASNIKAQKLGIIPGKRCYEVWGKSDKPHAFCMAEELWKTGKHQSLEIKAYGVLWDAHWIPVDKETYLHYAFDITELKQTEVSLKESEAKYRGLFDSSLDGVFQSDAKGVFTSVNQAMAEMLGHSSPQEVIGQPAKNYWGNPKERDSYTSELKSNTSVIAYPIKAKSGDGVEFDFEVTSKLLTDEKGKFVGIEGILRDVTERIKREKTIIEAYKELETLDTLKTDIISNVSHELRTPITIISTAMELLKNEEDPEKRGPLIELAIGAVNRQNKIVEDLITASTLQKNKSEIKLESLDIREVIYLLHTNLKTFAKSKKVILTLELDENTPNVRGDDIKIQHVLRNLIHNAIKFCNEGGKVTIKTRKKKDMVKICVQDTGIGISKKELGHIFMPLFQIDSSSTRTFEGIGMGLSIVKDLVEAQGGSIFVESTVDKGSTFCFTLPIV